MSSNAGAPANRPREMTGGSAATLSKGSLMLGRADWGVADREARDKYEEMGQAYKCFAIFMSYFKYVPVINFMWHAFLQTTWRDDVRMITPDSVREIANLIGLVAALLFTILTAMPTGLTWDEFSIVDQHWQGPSLDQFANAKDFEKEVGWDKNSDRSDTTADIIIGKYGCQYNEDYFGQPMSVRIGNTIGQGTTWLALDIILSMILVVSVSTLTRVDLAGDRVITDQTKANREGVEVPETAMNNWWIIARWVVICMCSALVWGIILTNRVLNDMYYVKWPQYWLVKACKDAGWKEVLKAGCTDPTDPDCIATFPTRLEVSTVQYSGGHFIGYQNSFDRSRLKSVGGLKDGYPAKLQDPMVASGVGYYVIVVITVVVMSLLGYAQLYADMGWRASVAEKDRKYEEQSTEQPYGDEVTIVVNEASTKTPAKKTSEAFGGFDAN
jgi:hypothetical protein